MFYILLSQATSATGTTAAVKVPELDGVAPYNGVFSSIGDYLAALITNYGIPIAVMAAVIVIVYAGFVYIHSGGSSDATGNAKELITGAIVGLITLLLIGYFLALIIPGI